MSCLKQILHILFRGVICSLCLYFDVIFSPFATKKVGGLLPLFLLRLSDRKSFGLIRLKTKHYVFLPMERELLLLIGFVKGAVQNKDIMHLLGPFNSCDLFLCCLSPSIDKPHTSRGLIYPVFQAGGWT